MTKSQMEYATRKALENFDRWNEVTGQFVRCSGYYAEILSIIEDAVHCGAQMALHGEIDFDEDGNIIY